VHRRVWSLAVLPVLFAVGCSSGKLETRAYTVRNDGEQKLIEAKLNQWTEDGILGLQMQASDDQQVLVSATPRVHRDIEAVIDDARNKAKAARQQ
jgi:hypothetical protein